MIFPRSRHATLLCSWVLGAALLGGISGVGCASHEAQPDEGDGASETSIGEVGDSPFWCVGQDVPQLPAPRPGQTVGLLVNVQDWVSLVPLAGRGLRGALCPGLDSGCAQPIGADSQELREGYVGPDALPSGLANLSGMVMPEGFDGFSKFTVSQSPATAEAERYVPLNYFRGGSISGELLLGPRLFMMQLGTRATILLDSFQNASATAVTEGGMLIVSVIGCNGDLMSDVRIEVSMTGAVAGEKGSTALVGVPFQLTAAHQPISQPSDRPLFTGPSAMAGFLGVPAGAVTLRAYQRDNIEPFATLDLLSIPGEISVGVLRPAYLTGANLQAGPFAPTF